MIQSQDLLKAIEKAIPAGVIEHLSTTLSADAVKYQGHRSIIN
jgi:hypothetical protein